MVSHYQFHLDWGFTGTLLGHYWDITGTLYPDCGRIQCLVNLECHKMDTPFYPSPLPFSLSPSPPSPSSPVSPTPRHTPQAPTWWRRRRTSGQGRPTREHSSWSWRRSSCSTSTSAGRGVSSWPSPSASQRDTSRSGSRTDGWSGKRRRTRREWGGSTPSRTRPLHQETWRMRQGWESGGQDIPPPRHAPHP